MIDVLFMDGTWTPLHDQVTHGFLDELPADRFMPAPKVRVPLPVFSKVEVWVLEKAPLKVEEALPDPTMSVPPPSCTMPVPENAPRVCV